MIFVLELPDTAAPLAWFAFDEADLLRKLAAADLPLLRATRERLGDDCEPLDLAEATLRHHGDCRVYRDEAQATAAFERADEPAWQGPGWRARLALRNQLIATEVLADDL